MKWVLCGAVLMLYVAAATVWIPDRAATQLVRNDGGDENGPVAMPDSIRHPVIPLTAIGALARNDGGDRNGPAVMPDLIRHPAVPLIAVDAPRAALGFSSIPWIPDRAATQLVRNDGGYVTPIAFDSPQPARNGGGVGSGSAVMPDLIRHPVVSLTAVSAPIPDRAAAQLARNGASHHALDAATPQAQAIADIAWAMFIAAALIFVVVMALAAYAVFGPAGRKRLAKRTLIVGGGIVFPVVALSALMIYVFAGVPNLLHRGTPALRIEVTGEQYWWRVRYLSPDDRPLAVTANEIHIPVGRTVELTLRTADVIHSFWVPNLAGKLDMIPGHVNTLRIEAARTGVYRGQCAEYCGAQHAKMALLLIASDAAQFDAWLATQAQPASADAHPGAALFVAHGCATCHTIRGTPARGTLGPDLTHVGSRRTIGAGLLPNSVGALAGWIADSQALKPGNRMPTFDALKADELHALARYMDSLQ